MSRYALIGLVLNIAGTVGFGVIPVVGLVAGFGGPIVWRSPKWAWRGAWVISGLVSIVGAVLSALH